MSHITTTWIDVRPPAKGIPCKGIAFGGDRGISRVEVSMDDGRSWADAKLDYPGTRLTWALWSYDWRPAGPARLHAGRPRHQCRRRTANIR